MSWGAVAGAAVSVVGGSLMSGDNGNGNGGGGGNAISPWWQGGGGAQASDMLQKLMSGGPQSILEDKAFQQSQKYGLQATQRALGAQGMHLSGNEAIAMNDYSQRGAMDFYNQQVHQLGNLAGAGQSLAGGVSANSNAWQAGNQNQQAGWGNIASGIGGLASLYGSGKFGGSSSQSTGGINGSNNYNPNMVADYAAFGGG